MTEVGDCRPICTKCGEPVEIQSVRKDGWIQLAPHSCKPSPPAPETDDEACTQCGGTGWDRMRERTCDCTSVETSAVNREET